MTIAPTMDDVARAAGYSRATVSLALRRARSIPDHTRVQIESAARQIGYRPNPLIAALMSLHRKRRPTAAATTIAYVTHHVPEHSWRDVPDFRDMFMGASTRAEELNCRLEVFELHKEGMSAVRLRDILAARGIHALLVAPLPRDETVLEFDFSDLAVVGLGPSVRTPPIERVSNDQFQSAMLSVEQCLALGYRRIGLVLNRQVSLRTEGRWRGGYAYAVDQHQIKDPPPVLLTDAESEIPALVRDWWQAHQPDVVIKSNLGPALAAALPAHVGLVSLSVNDAGGMQTGIYQNLPLIGRQALDHVMTKLNTTSFGVSAEAPLHLTAGKWVRGQTAPGPDRLRYSPPT